MFNSVFKYAFLQNLIFQPVLKIPVRYSTLRFFPTVVGFRLGLGVADYVWSSGQIESKHKKSSDRVHGVQNDIFVCLYGF